MCAMFLTIKWLGTACPASRSATAAQKKFGFVPNLFRVMAEAPAAGEAYVAVMDIFESSSLSDAEQQTILLSASFVNECDLVGVS